MKKPVQQHEFDWLSLQYGLCPLCDTTFDTVLKHIGDMVLCPRECGFRMEYEKYLLKCAQVNKQTKTRPWGFHRVKHNSFTEDELYEDVCRIN